MENEKKELDDENGDHFLVSVKLMKELFSKDGMRRHDARLQLEKEGRRVTPLLIGALKSHNIDVRWEAAKALITIRDPLAISALTESLMDEDYEVRWLAAEALIALGEKSVIPILRTLLGHYDSIHLRKGAHHVFEELKKNDHLEIDTIEILRELQTVLPQEPYPLAAKEALDKLLNKQADQEQDSENMEVDEEDRANLS